MIRIKQIFLCKYRCTGQYFVYINKFGVEKWSQHKRSYYVEFVRKQIRQILFFIHSTHCIVCQPYEHCIWFLSKALPPLPYRSRWWFGHRAQCRVCVLRTYVEKVVMIWARRRVMSTCWRRAAAASAALWKYSAPVWGCAYEHTHTHQCERIAFAYQQHIYT